MNITERKNFPAIDLGDRENRIAFQVTAERGINKVRDTVNTFYEHDLRKDYDHLFILILSSKPDFNIKLDTLKGDLKTLEVWDVDDVICQMERQVLLNEVKDHHDAMLRDIEEFTRRELPAVVRAVATNEGKDDFSLLGRLEMVIGYPPVSAQRFLASYDATTSTEAVPAMQEINQFYEALKNRSYLGNRQILVHAIANALTREEFEQRFNHYNVEYLPSQTLIFYPKLVSEALNGRAQEAYKDQLFGLQYFGWAKEMEMADFLSIGLYMRSLDANFFYLLRRFLNNDIDKLRAVLVNLDFRLLE